MGNACRTSNKPNDGLLPDGRVLNRELVKAGFAWWYRKYAPDDEPLEQLKREARGAKRRFWAEPPSWAFLRALGPPTPKAKRYHLTFRITQPRLFGHPQGVELVESVDNVDLVFRVYDNFSTALAPQARC